MIATHLIEEHGDTEMPRISRIDGDLTAAVGRSLFFHYKPETATADEIAHIADVVETLNREGFADLDGDSLRLACDCTLTAVGHGCRPARGPFDD